MLFLINGEVADSIAIADRGLAYGDGIFETILFVGGKPVLWCEHIARLQRGCEVLKLPYVSIGGLKERIGFLLRTANPPKLSDSSVTFCSESKCVVKIIITRGCGGRGYSPRNCQLATEIIGLYPAPVLNQEIYCQGLDIRILNTPTVSHPVLAGLKHLNRLEQVLASAELSSTEFEGVMCDQNGCLIEGTKSNILYKRNNHWLTTRLEHSGIRGVLRDHLLKHGESLGIKVEEREILQAECSSIEAMAMVNSVFGVLPVRNFASFELDVDCVINEVQTPIHQAFPF